MSGTPEAIGSTRPGGMPLFLRVTVHIYSLGNLATTLRRLYIFVRRKRVRSVRPTVGAQDSAVLATSALRQLTEW